MTSFRAALLIFLLFRATSLLAAELAFTELMRRHVGLVYSATGRMV